MNNEPENNEPIERNASTLEDFSWHVFNWIVLQLWGVLNLYKFPLIRHFLFNKAANNK